MPSPPRPRDRRALALAAALAWPAAAQGAAPCQVRLAPGAPGAWLEAARDAEKRLTSAAHDCREISVLVLPDGSATLRFSTSDGRTAERLLGAPDELGPLIEALVAVTLPATPPEAPAPEAPAPAAPPPEAPTPAPAAVRPEPQLLGALEAGGRVTAQYLSPTFGAGVRGVLDRWEVDLLAEWVPLHRFLRKKRAEDFSMSLFLLGAQLGRRAPAWRGALRYGATVSIAQVHAEGDATDAGEPPTLDRAQTRVGVHAGFIFPENTAARFSVDLRGEAVVLRTGRATAQEKLLPSQPGFGLILTLGVEGRLL